MRRKIVLHGPSSLCISLPNSWAKLHGMKKGDEVDVRENGADLLVSPTESRKEKKTEISISGMNRETRKDILIALHKKGYDEVKITFEDIRSVKDLLACINEMHLGFEVIKQEQKSVVIRDISNPDGEQLDNLVRRLFRITIEYASRVAEVMAEKEEATESCLLHDVSIRRISNHCKRILNKHANGRPPYLLCIIECLEMVSGDLTALLEALKDRSSHPQKVIDTSAKLVQLLSGCYDLYYAFSFSSYDKVRLASIKAETSIKGLPEGEITSRLARLHDKISIMLPHILASHI